MAKKSSCIWGDEPERVEELPPINPFHSIKFPHPWRIKDKPNLSNIHPQDERHPDYCPNCDCPLEDCDCLRCDECGKLIDDCDCVEDSETF